MKNDVLEIWEELGKQLNIAFAHRNDEYFNKILEKRKKIMKENYKLVSDYYMIKNNVTKG